MQYFRKLSAHPFSFEQKISFFEGSVAEELRLHVKAQEDENPQDPKWENIAKLQKNIAELETSDSQDGKQGKDIFSYQDVEKYLQDVFGKVKNEILSLQTKDGASDLKTTMLLKDLEGHIKSNISSMKPGMEIARNDMAFLRTLWILSEQIEQAVKGTKIQTEPQIPKQVLETQPKPTQEAIIQETSVTTGSTPDILAAQELEKPVETSAFKPAENTAPKESSTEIPVAQNPVISETPANTNVVKPNREGYQSESGEKEVTMFNEAKRFLEETSLENRLEKLTSPAIKIAELRSGDMFRMNFRGNKYLEQSITSSNIFPNNIRQIEVDHSQVSPARLQSGILQGERDTENGDFWEIKDGKRIQRLSLYEGTQVKIISKENSPKISENNTADEQLKSRGIDPDFLKTAQESGLFPKEGLSFGEIINTIIRQEGGFIQAFGKAPYNYPLKSSHKEYSPQFFGYALEQYRSTMEIQGERTIDKDFVKQMAQTYFLDETSANDAVIMFEHQLLGTRFKEIQDKQFSFSLDGKIKNLKEEVAQASEVAEFLALQQPLRGPLTNISEIQYQGKTILKCKGTESPYVHSDVAKDLIALALLYRKQTGLALELSSVYRDLATQAELAKKDLDHDVADVGKSTHNLGRGIDVSLFYQQAKSKSLNRGRLNQFQQTAKMLNFKPLPGEAWHFDWSPGSNPLPKESERVEISTNMDTLFKRYEKQERVVNPTDTTDIISPTV